MASQRIVLRRTGAHVARTIASAALAALLLSACADEGPRPVPVMFRVVGATPVSVAVGETIELRGECLDAQQRPIRGSVMGWVVPQGEYVPDSIRARVVLKLAGDRVQIRGVNVGSVTVAGGCMSWNDLALETGPLWWTRGPFGSGQYDLFRVDVTEAPDSLWYVDLPSDTLRLRAPTDDDSLSGVQALLTIRRLGTAAVTRDPTEFTWRVDDSTVAMVAPDGRVRALRAGETVVRVARGPHERRVPVQVAAAAAEWDVGLVDAHWTQGAQDPLQRVPIVRNGRAAVVNVLAFATRAAPPSFVVLEVWNASATRIWTDRVPLAPSTDSAPSFGAPSAQFLVPRTVLRDAATWRVVRDSSAGPDARVANDAWPRSGVRTLLAFSAPTLELRLVPLQLAANDNAVTTIAESQRVFYDSIARIRLPLGPVTVTVERPLVVSRRVPSRAELAANPQADAGLYQDFLNAVDARRMASGARRSAYWLGVIPMHAPDAARRIGGMAFMPAVAGDDGPMTRSMLALSHEWYTSPVSTGTIIAHELGHNFGLHHAPCGSAPWPDPAYPVPGGGIGFWVHRVSAWELGVRTDAPAVPYSTCDFMGYTSSNWVSPFHMRVMIEWMALGGVSLRAPASPQRVVAVRGTLDAGITVHSASVVDADPAEGRGVGPLVELLAPDGRVLASVNARAGRLADGTGLPFVAFVPIETGIDVAGLRVRVTHESFRVVAAVETP